MKQAKQATREQPPSLVIQQASFPTQAYGYASRRYWAFLEALYEGQLEYDSRKGGTGNAPHPLPAA